MDSSDPGSAKTDKLATLAVLITVATAAFSQLFSWYYQPFITEGNQSSLIPPIFDLQGIAFAAWTLAAFAIGALAACSSAASSPRWPPPWPYMPGSPSPPPRSCAATT
jgi:hypothetical protein